MSSQLSQISGSFEVPLDGSIALSSRPSRRSSTSGYSSTSGRGLRPICWLQRKELFQEPFHSGQITCCGLAEPPLSRCPVSASAWKRFPFLALLPSHHQLGGIPALEATWQHPAASWSVLSPRLAGCCSKLSMKLSSTFRVHHEVEKVHKS